MSSKLTALTDLAGGQVPTDLTYVVDPSAGAAGSKKSTLNDLIEQITKNITDGVLKGINGSGPNGAGGNFDLSGGRGTGAGAPGAVQLRYPLIGASGSTLQSLSADRFPVSTSLYTNTTPGSVIANTTSETSIFTGATPSSGSTLTIQAGSARAGTMYRLRVYSLFQTNGTPTIRFKIKFGSVIVADSTAFTSPNTNNLTGLMFMDAYLYINAVGSGGLVRADVEGRMNPGLSGANTPTFFLAASGEPTVNFTANQTIDVTAQWGAADVGNIFQLLTASLQRIR